MARGLKKFFHYVKKARKKITSYDFFGIPIAVNYKGEDTYKSFFGAICSFFIVILILAFTIQGASRLFNRDEPDRSSYRLTNSRTADDPLNMPDSKG